ncbi:MAG: hypothetical protein JJU36_15425 [Phycisphaeraceae bacterium]|nr:hypothetical protein [Phycisphaeraceae bacterium]
MAGCIPAPPDPERYFLALGTSERTFEDDDQIEAAGIMLGDSVTIMLNDQPIGLHRAAGTLLEINAWLLPGENEVQLLGRSDQPLYLKLAMQQSGRVQRVLGRWRIEPFDESSGPKSFDAGNRPESLLPTDETDFRRMSPDDLRRELRPFIEELNTLLEPGRHEELAARLTEGLMLWSPHAFGAPRKRLESLRRAATRRFEAVAGRFDPIDPQSITIIPGRSVVLVYQSLGEGPHFNPRITRFQIDNQWHDIGALYLVRDEDRWIIWSTGELRH